jgi:hypothetical protein
MRKDPIVENIKRTQRPKDSESASDQVLHTIICIDRTTFILIQGSFAMSVELRHGDEITVWANENQPTEPYVKFRFVDAKDEQELGIRKLWWTSFYIGCLENKYEICCFNTRPRFRIIDRIDRHGISKGDILFLNQRGYFERVAFASIAEFDVKFDQGQQTSIRSGVGGRWL